MKASEEHDAQDVASVQKPVMRPGRGQLAVVLLLALGLRLMVLWTALTRFPRGWFFTRGMEMGLLAKSVVDGLGLSSPFGVPTGPTAFIAPGYPLLVALIFRVLGSDTVGSAAFIISVQIVLNLVTIWLMMRVATMLFGHGAAWIAGLVWACSLPLIWIPTIFWDTSVAICLFVGLLALVLEWRAQMTTGRWALLGAYCAVTGLINPAMLPALVAMLGWLWFQQPRREVRGALLAAVTLCVLFSPWPIRNARVFHAFIPLRTTVGFELWMGNRPGADGFLNESLFPSFNPAELARYRQLGELGYTAEKSAVAKRFIAAHPGTFLRLTLVRVVRYWLGTGSKDSSKLFALHAGLTSLLGFLGLYLLWRRKGAPLACLFLLPMLVFPLPYYITHAEFRYRLALDPIMTLLTSYALVAIFAGKTQAGRDA